MLKYALGIEYSGARYCGWQRQSHCPSIQAHIEKALSKVADEAIVLYCAGRTDAGVHATHQVVHFETNAKRAEIAWVRGANTYLPPDIRILWAQSVPEDFDARRTALSRRYLYLFLSQSVSPGIMHEGVTWVHPRLDLKKMQEGAKHLIGEHDFTTFRATGCQAKTPVRHVKSFSLKQFGKHTLLDITANAFLHHMVRNIAGSLYKVGIGEQRPDWIKAILQDKDRRLAGKTAPPNGLYLIQVTYPERFKLTQSTRYPWPLASNLL